MKKQTITRFALFIAIILLLFPLALQADDFRPAMLANPCAGCHGTDGNSPGAIPALNNLSSKYILISMKAFKSDQRQGTVMNRIAKGYTDQEIELMADYFEGVNKSRQ